MFNIKHFFRKAADGVVEAVSSDPKIDDIVLVYAPVDRAVESVGVIRFKTNDGKYVVELRSDDGKHSSVLVDRAAIRPW